MDLEKLIAQRNALDEKIKAEQARLLRTKHEAVIRAATRAGLIDLPAEEIEKAFAGIAGKITMGKAK